MTREIEIDGRKVLVAPSALMHHTCKSCKAEFYAESNEARFCPKCGRQEFERVWMSLVLIEQKGQP